MWSLKKSDIIITVTSVVNLRNQSSALGRQDSIQKVLTLARFRKGTLLLQNKVTKQLGGRLVAHYSE
jgi:hypothetical protein